MIDKTLVKLCLNERLKNIDNFVDNNILHDPINDLIHKYSSDLQDYEYIDSVELFSTLVPKGSMKYINRYDKQLRTGGLLIKIYKKNNEWYGIIKSAIGKNFYISFRFNYIFYTESKPSLITSWASLFVSDVEKGNYTIK